MSLLFIFTTAYVVALSGALIPGPLLSVIIRESLQQGWRSGLLIGAGHGLAEIAMLALFAVGLNQVLHVQWITAAIGIGGGAVLLYMGADICRSAIGGVVGADLEQVRDGTVQVRAASRLLTLRSGILASVVNPYWVLWWFTIGILYVTQALKAGILGLGSFYGGHILADLSWFVFVAFAVATGKRFLSPFAHRCILGACGLFLLGLGVYFICRGAGAMAAL